MEFELEHEGKTYLIDADVNFYTEHYGADADGNRGIDRRCFEVDRVKIYAENSQDVTNELESVLEQKINDYIGDYGDDQE